ncbi:hypothetical protein JQ554_15385 [Bradyrhizobium diazoefficiens]|nr:hypothetical protein [Bradyrhizobium diazoefficiens]MBR0965675.1 hypothetical protein [Bradyrhizobium diazoefficiens]MBR0979367.1 hypothetical protein [Bradyrhizobium diazoefficiens]MBR1008559.1 hypothetical protein [Bradyrhizobium diazoefficiens]MBR1014692.1 hypothetical protein [Bradyrhizobium diazoefficiens]MBR1052520.1 hypothetical protein [Bradyrhizobium diazoefficiens]
MMGQLATFLARIFPSKKEKKGPCCGMEFEQIESEPAASVSTGKETCACSTNAETNKVRPQSLA